MRFDDPNAGNARYPGSLLGCLRELPSRVRAEIDMHEFARLDRRQCAEIDGLADRLRAHVIAYDLRTVIRGLPLCVVAGQAFLDRDQIAELHAVERRLPSGVALVAYARPTEMRLPENVLVRAGKLANRVGQALDPDRLG